MGVCEMVGRQCRMVAGAAGFWISGPFVCRRFVEALADVVFCM